VGWTHDSTSPSPTLLHVRTPIPKGLRYRHQEWKVVASSPEIPLLKFSTLASPLSLSNFFPFLLPPSPPLGLPELTPPAGSPYDVNGIVLARVSCRVAVVSVNWRLHPTPTGKDRRTCASETLSDSASLDKAIHNQDLGFVTVTTRRNVLACRGHPQYI